MPEITFLKRLEAAPRVRTQIFTVAPPDATPKALLQHARTLGLDPKGGRLAQDPAKLTYEDGPHLLTLYRASGAVRYQDQTRWQHDDGESNVEMADDEAVKRALAIVEKYKLARPAECATLKVSRLTVGSADVEGKSATERVIDIGVAFQRTIGGVAVDGPGGKLIVYLDHKGEMTGFDRIWRVTKGAQPVKGLRTPRAAEADLLRYWKASDAHIEVQEERFGYFELGFQDTQKVLQPAYVLMLSLVSPERNIRMNSVHVYAAATNSIGRLMPAAKVAKPQEPRKE